MVLAAVIEWNWIEVWLDYFELNKMMMAETFKEDGLEFNWAAWSI